MKYLIIALLLSYFNPSDHSYEIRTQEDTLYIDYSADYNAYELHSDECGQLTDRMELIDIIEIVSIITTIESDIYLCDSYYFNF